ncbi:polysaccharide deacetylase family protein [Flavobacterium noncentrifugens]|uniref:Polysaccharide deacetylase n=1 Tax=Flavobacterium noncentrifugens TaxID=1128970 RepID=A0A1G8XV07_9FLAO|nr:polysaccharide deacetylase [Flavobacterium noncentrifugens]SDJ94419.1 hypothetical protein SAMN04487935_2077 [Flavobacterium noncentrifugens]
MRQLVLLVFFLSTLSNASALEKGISNYKVYFGFGSYANKKIAAIRKYEQSGKVFYIGVDVNSLETINIPVSEIRLTVADWPKILVVYSNSPYVKAIQTAQKQSFSLQDAGIVNGYPKEKGITLTIDLCPSHKPLDRVVFTSLISEFKKIEQPVPIALSITGSFMLTHPEDLQWLQKLNDSGEIAITWVNHTYNHHFDPKIPLRENFLLEPGTDLNFEILGTEMALLQKGLLFSAFFRFPGLISDHDLIEKVTGFGLIPIGSDAWLAKGQAAHNGTIVLIHGNGNEPLGVKDFIKLLQTEKSEVLNKQWLLYDLRETVSDEFRDK